MDDDESEDQIADIIRESNFVHILRDSQDGPSTFRTVFQGPLVDADHDGDN